MTGHAAWRHHGARDGFEVVFVGDRRVAGLTTAVEEGHAWAVEYSIELDPGWVTRRAEVRNLTLAGSHAVTLEADGEGGWLVDGVAALHLDGCLDVDLESSAFTNAFPVGRLGLGIGESAEAPAAYVRALDLSVERLEQRYERVGDREYEYEAPRLEFACRLAYDEAGLVLDYPGIANRI